MKTQISIVAIVVLLVSLIYPSTQGLGFSTSPEQFGFYLEKGRYRSWTLSFSDGRVFTPTGWKSVINTGPDKWEFGYRYWPKFRHLDMNYWPKSWPQ